MNSVMSSSTASSSTSAARTSAASSSASTPTTSNSLSSTLPRVRKRHTIYATNPPPLSSAAGSSSAAAAAGASTSSHRHSLISSTSSHHHNNSNQSGIGGLPPSVPSSNNHPSPHSSFNWNGAALNGGGGHHQHPSTNLSSTNGSSTSVLNNVGQQQPSLTSTSNNNSNNSHQHHSSSHNTYGSSQPSSVGAAVGGGGSQTPTSNWTPTPTPARSFIRMCTRAKRIRFFRNGDAFYKGVWYALTADRFRGMDSLMEDLTRALDDLVNLPHGVRHIFTVDGAKKIGCLEDLEDGQSYVCSSNELFKRIDYFNAKEPVWNYSLTPKGNHRTSEDNTLVLDNDPNDKFNPQAIEPNEFVRPRIITVIRNGIRPRKVIRLLLNKRTAPTYRQVLTDITAAVKLDSGFVRKIFTLSGKLVNNLAEFFAEDDVFIACGKERLSIDDFYLATEEYKFLFPGQQGVRSAASSSKIPQQHHGTRSPKFTHRNLLPSSKITSKLNGPSPLLRRRFRNLRKEPDLRNSVPRSIHHHPPVPTIPEEGNGTELIHLEKELQQGGGEKVGKGGLALSASSGIPRLISSSNNSSSNNPAAVNNNRKQVEQGTNRCRTVRNGGQPKQQFTNSRKNHKHERPPSNDQQKLIRRSLSERRRRDDVDDGDVDVDDLIMMTTDDDRNDHHNEESSPSPSPPPRRLSPHHPNHVREVNDNDDEEEGTGEEEEEEEEEEDEDSESAPVQTCGTGPVIQPTEYPVAITDCMDVLNMVGDGNFAVVHQAVFRNSGETVALKIIDKSKYKESELVESEVNLLRATDHENIVSLIDIWDLEEHCYLAMEYVPGGDLFDGLMNVKYYDEIEAAGLMNNLASALDYLHERQIAHRDIKPENLLMYEGPGGVKQLKLADFGLACRADEILYTVCGTPTYVSPEMLAESGLPQIVDAEILSWHHQITHTDKATKTAHGAASLGRSFQAPPGHSHHPDHPQPPARPPDEVNSKKTHFYKIISQMLPYSVFKQNTNPLYGVKVDVWAMGVICYIMLCGFPPFISLENNQDELFQLIIHGNYSFPSPYWDHISQAARSIIQGMLQTQVEDRYASGEVLIHPWTTGEAAVATEFNHDTSGEQIDIFGAKPSRSFFESQSVEFYTSRRRSMDNLSAISPSSPPPSFVQT